MKAIVLKEFGGVDNFELQDVLKPVVSAHDVLVRIKAAAFNPIDYQMRQGGNESKLLKSMILGREFAGVVESVGKLADHISIGDAVVAYAGSLGSNGTYTEYISIPQELVAVKPENVSFEDAAAVPVVGMTALQCFERLKISASDSVFIGGGAGGVGTMLIKLLMAYGIDQIITTAGNEESRSHLLAMGIKENNIINYKVPDFIDKILALNNGVAFDYCIDLVGGKISEICRELVKVAGVYADVTYLATEKAKKQLFGKAVMVVNISNYAYTLSGNRTDLGYYGEKLSLLMKTFEEGRISVPKAEVVGELSLETVISSHRMLEGNLTNGKKLVMRVGDL